MELRLLAPPDRPLLTAAAVRTGLPLAAGIPDEILERFVARATQALEQETWRQFVPATYELRLASFPVGEIPLPRPPLLEVLSVACTNAEGQPLALLAREQFFVARQGTPGRIHPAPGTRWPQGASDVVITYRAGFPDLPPQHLACQAVRCACDEWSALREPGDWTIRSPEFHRIARALRARDPRFAPLPDGVRGGDV